MRLPPESVLLAAARWLEVLPGSGGIPRARALLATHAQYSDLTPTQYDTALGWLREHSLLGEAQALIPVATRVLAAVFEHAPPLWVQDADQLVKTPLELPPDVVSVGRVLGLDADAVHSQLVASWGKVDTARRELVGAAGETALVRLLQQIKGGECDHVSTWSDGFGYDIAFTHGHHSAHLEVKTTTRAGRFTAYLSRHEASVMLRDERWVLAAVRLNSDLQITGVGTVSREWIAANLPRDVGRHGSWSACKLEIPAAAISNRVGELGDDAADSLPEWPG